MASVTTAARGVIQAKNPYRLRQRGHGFYVLVSEVDGSRTATHWTASEDRAREHVRRRGNYGVRFARAESVQLATREADGGAA